MGALIPLIAIVPLVRDDPRALGILLVVLGAILLLPFVVGTVQWACFRFGIAGDRLLIRKGVLKKTALDLPYERVQGINVRRSPVTACSDWSRSPSILRARSRPRASCRRSRRRWPTGSNAA